MNVWFDVKLRSARTKALVALIEATSPLEVCCLQEVVPEVARDLVQALPSWSCSDPGDGSTVVPYGVLTLVAPGLPVHFAFHQLPTNMCRRLLVVDLGGRLSIGNVHLESLDNQPLRVLQLRACAEALRAAKEALLVGDFNFDAQRNYQAPHLPLHNDALADCLPGFVDIWPALRSDRGITYNSVVNPYISRGEMMRYDRAMARVVAWLPIAIELFGHEAVDHFVDISPKEQQQLDRPPTPPRPSVRPRVPIWDDVDDPPAFDLACCTGAGAASPGADEAVTTPRLAALAPRAFDEAPPETPPRAGRRLFLSDHFGLLVSLVESRVASEQEAPADES